MELKNPIGVIDKHQDIYDTKVAAKLANHTVTDCVALSYKNDPETILIERERKELLAKLYDAIKYHIHPVDLAILLKYISCNNNIRETARVTNLNKNKISRSLKKVQHLVEYILKTEGVSPEDFKEYFRPEINSYITSHASHVGYPSEQYMNLPTWRSWTIKYGTKRFTAKKSCLIPEFLEASGLPDCQCNICNEKCSRCDVFTGNAVTEKQITHEQKVLECIKNIKSSYKK